MLWRDTLNFTTHDFAKGPRILNMVMTFVLTLWSHYNTIIEPNVRFIFSFLEGLSIDFPSHMIVSMIDIYQDTTTRNKLTFPSAILSHTCTFLFLLHISSLMGAISKESM